MFYSFSQAKNVYYTDFIDFTDNSGVKYDVMMITDQHGDDGRADSTVRVLYTTDENEHLIQFYADCYYEKLKNGNTRISFIPQSNSTVQIIKGKDVTYNPDTFVYEIDTKTGQITGTQSDKKVLRLSLLLIKTLSCQHKTGKMKPTDSISEPKICIPFFKTFMLKKQITQTNPILML